MSAQIRLEALRLAVHTCDEAEGALALAADYEAYVLYGLSVASEPKKVDDVKEVPVEEPPATKRRRRKA